MNNEILFFNHYDGPYYPHLKLLHHYPDILPKVQVDKGAIKFVLSGAQIMCPGLTSPGARLPGPPHNPSSPPLPAECVVAVMAEGKEHALAVGLTKMSTEDIKKINKGIGVDNVHYLADGLYKSKMEV
ncbi:Malignant T-cell-amplified sequence 1 [Quaeritorhiza haematococci]|nr:Malignant T-cell-amplified sequence 1 [Quaeritorhiza haematococci]